MKKTGDGPLVSVIMPAYNAAKYIADSIESVQRQTFTDWELIIVDDGSTDDTAWIVKDLQVSDSRIKYYYQQNKKQAAARNTGIKNAKGKWIAYLDADDFWSEEKLEMQLVAAEENDADVIFSNGYYLDVAKDELQPYDGLAGKFSGRELYPKLFGHNYIPVLSVLHKMSLVKQVGLQDESLQVYGCEDWDYWLRCCRFNATFFGMAQRLFKYRYNGSGTSSNKRAMYMAGCYVLFKNYDEKLLKGNEKDKAKDALRNTVRTITNELYALGETTKVLHYLNLLNGVSSSNFKFIIASILTKILKRRSRRFVNYVMYR